MTDAGHRSTKLIQNDRIEHAGLPKAHDAITSGGVEFWENLQPLLLRQPNFTYEFGEPWVGAHRIEAEVSPQTLDLVVALFVGGVEPPKGFVFFSQPGVEIGDVIRGPIARLPLRLPDLNAFGQRALPASRMKALFQSRGKLSVLRVPIQFPEDLEFFHCLRVHTLAPIGESQTIVGLGECRVLTGHFLAGGNGIVVASYRDLSQSHSLSDDRGQWIELVSAIHFVQRLLLPAANPANILPMPLAGRGVGPVKVSSLFVLGFPPR